MAEDERPRIGLKTGFQAGAFIGLFLGFSLAVVSALDPARRPRSIGAIDVHHPGGLRHRFGTVPWIAACSSSLQ